MDYSTIILASLLVSSLSLIGIFAFSKKINKVASYFIAIATGALLGDVFIHILPEIIEEKTVEPGIIFLFVLAGILGMFIFESIFRHIHCHETMEHNHFDEHSAEHKHSKNPLGIMNLVGNSLHNYIDGALIAASFLISPVVGWSTTLAIILHEVPVEISNFMLLVHSGYSKSKALLYNGLTALFGLLGTISILALGDSVGVYLPYFSALAAGFLLYIAMSDLIPEIHTNHSKKPNYVNLVLIILAILFMYLLTKLEP
jgi:zinc and cadmium transporter